ncbi:sterol desaturase family protein [Mycolicibacterium novocastrense]|uniref:Sterol desaturase n=1 Tax=Mycolicibacterium novocastrense TaxID=59813 RepID=A0AAW5SJD7_MYCNV|nr:sterol desaturase family protein [Mycolicibacterium novocastrense]MCV7024310.1 sterol desaturase family protein [Mycolicibacterium novocastrense]GAT06879.1 sterol desaturase [Mycolicibacterium novocastrense]
MSTLTHTSAHTLARYGYVPFMLLGLNGAAIALAAAGAPKYWLLVILAVAIVTSFLVERLIPYDSDWNHDRSDSTRDRIHVVVNETLILASVAAIPLLAAIVPGPGIWPTGWPFVLQVLTAILVADLGITVVHLASHKIAVLWRFHAVHHSITRFYGLNGLMKHPLHQSVEMAAGVAPLILIGLPVDVASVLALAVAIQLLLQHSNADYRIGPAKYLLALNEGHRFHHLKWAGIGDVNFGLFTLIWDHLMRTYSYDPTRRFDSTQLGMAAKPDYPNGYLAQLIYPFTNAGGCQLHSATPSPPATVTNRSHDGSQASAQA